MRGSREKQEKEGMNRRAEQGGVEEYEISSRAGEEEGTWKQIMDMQRQQMEVVMQSVMQMQRQQMEVQVRAQRESRGKAAEMVRSSTGGAAATVREMPQQEDRGKGRGGTEAGGL